ncbi:hypothetical protein ADK52_28095 [Streptomyces sp. WM6372]|uniref:hypothetical protein n=1 Tax=Streptomyces sp. WM6372 TaxID=1415555 RepID=UPI0006AED04E|nr:hypothetical protein [Streptomyces sp. WM6372]KOU19688.1 hypothetical protein ADK52_28095 [Streptomyces sp. WM6372]
MSAAAPGRLAAVPLGGPVPFDGRVLEVPRGRYDWLHLEVRAAEAAEATLWLHFAGGTDPETAEIPAGAAVRLRVPVTRRDELERVRLPERAGLVLLALTTVVPAPAGLPDPHESGLVTT